MTTAEQLKKALHTGQAMLACAGIAADLIEDDRGQLQLVVSVGAETRSFASLAEVRAWLEQLRDRASAA